MWKLSHPVQCKSCPWRVESDLADIPNYSVDQHQSLWGTIAESGSVEQLESPEWRQMACHQSPVRGDSICIGWLYNQVNEGNSIFARFQMLSCENAKDLRVIGDQVETFEQTFH